MIHQVFSDSLQSKNFIPLYTEKFPWDKGGPNCSSPWQLLSIYTKLFASLQSAKLTVQISKKEHLFWRSLKSNILFSICEEHSEAMTPQDWVGTTSCLFTMEEPNL